MGYCVIKWINRNVFFKKSTKNEVDISKIKGTIFLAKQVAALL